MVPNPCSWPVRHVAVPPFKSVVWQTASRVEGGEAFAAAIRPLTGVARGLLDGWLPCS